MTGVQTCALPISGILFYNRARATTGPGKTLRSLPPSFYGMCLAHIGFAVTVIGIVITSNYSTDVHKRMQPGDQEQLGGYTFAMEEIRTVNGPNYEATEAVFRISRGEKYITELHTQKRIYNASDMPMTEAGISPGLTRDLYVSLGEPLEGGAWSVRLYHKPFVRWLWLGALLMALGGVLAVADRRYRQARSRVADTQSVLGSGAAAPS